LQNSFETLLETQGVRRPCRVATKMLLIGVNGLSPLETTVNSTVIDAAKHRGMSPPACVFTVLIASLIVAIYAGEMRRLWDTWLDHEALSYGMLVPPVAAYVAWLQRKRVLSMATDTDLRGLALVAAASGMFLAGRLGAEFFLTRTSLVLLLAGLVWTFWGWQRLRALAFPFILLESSIPLPMLLYNNLTLPLQLLASGMATWLIQALGYSIYQEGNVLHLPTITLGVAEACSGLNSLGALMVGSLVMGFLECGRASGRVLLFLLAIPLAIGINVIRIAGTALLGDYDSRLAMGFYHSFSGWLVFVLGLGIMILVAKQLHRLFDRERV
jgi:exosortase